jgi:hypothetical protein
VTGAGTDKATYDTTVSLALPPGTPSATYEGVAIKRHFPESATLLPDGRVLLFENGYLETYDPASGKCADAGFISPGGEWYPNSATLLTNGIVLFEGGDVIDPITGDAPNIRTAVLYDPAGGSLTTGSLLVARGNEYTATLLPDGSVLIAGGEEDNDGNALASAELIKP